MPEVLEAGVLYVSEEFEVAGHLCACGCGNKVMTPLGPTDWAFEEVNGGPSLRPSIGSWQLPCQSHYWIASGAVKWAEKWTPEQIERGRRGEEERLREYFRVAQDREAGAARRAVALAQRARGARVSSAVVRRRTVRRGVRGPVIDSSGGKTKVGAPWIDFNPVITCACGVAPSGITGFISAAAG